MINAGANDREPAAKTTPRADRLRVVAHLPGRLRVRAATFRMLPEVASEVVSRVREEPGVSSATVSSLTGSVLVLYDPAETQILRLLRTIVVTGGLAGLEVDKRDVAASALPGDRVRGVLRDIDTRIRAVAGGKAESARRGAEHAGAARPQQAPHRRGDARAPVVRLALLVLRDLLQPQPPTGQHQRWGGRQLF